MPKTPRTDETVIHAATSNGTSLRTTVPAFAISQLGLKKGDVLRWEIDKDEDGLFLKIRSTERQTKK